VDGEARRIAAQLPSPQLYESVGNFGRAFRRPLRGLCVSLALLYESHRGNLNPSSSIAFGPGLRTSLVGVLIALVPSTASAFITYYFVAQRRAREALAALTAMPPSDHVGN
jgi:hypothetical protein